MLFSIDLAVNSNSTISSSLNLVPGSLLGQPHLTSLVVLTFATQKIIKHTTPRLFSFAACLSRLTLAGSCQNHKLYVSVVITIFSNHILWPLVSGCNNCDLLWLSGGGCGW
jgi:hypothetical protein